MHWLKRFRGTLGAGLTWAAIWAVGGVAIGVSSVVLPFLPWDRFFSVFDAPLPALAIPGFVGGLLFSAVLRVAGRRTRFADLSMARFAAWGALGGLLLTGVPIALIGLELLTNADRSLAALVRITSAITVPFTLLGAISAAGSLWVARRASDPRDSDASSDAQSQLAAGRSAITAGRPTAEVARVSGDARGDATLRRDRPDRS
jgi:hypothetical protein